MATPRRSLKTPSKHALFDPAGWAVRGDLEFLGASGTSMAHHFALDASGRWRSTTARPANAVGMRMDFGDLESEFHSHGEAQLLFLVRGEGACETERAVWIVPPQSALWIPANVVHKIRARAPLEGYGLIVEPGAASAKLPRDCCALSVTPLFRELLVRLATRPAVYDLDGPDARMAAVLLDELAVATVEKHLLPMPSEPRLRRLVDGMTKNPADGATLQTWARRMGIGERTLNRLLVRETGLSFGRWRQQLHINLALQWLSRGATVQSVANDLGYESASSFITMFRRVLGSSPARYMARRLEAADGT